MREDFLEKIPETLAESYLAMEEEILRDICRRFETSGAATASALHQIRQLQAYGVPLKEIEKRIQKTLGMTQKELEKLFQEAVEREQVYAKALLEQAEVMIPVVGEGALLLESIERIQEQTKGELYNITQSLGFSLKSNGKTTFYYIAEAYQKVLDKAFLEVSSGVMDYNTAIKGAVKALADSGIRYVYYDKNGKRWTDHVDVAVRRAVRTGTVQMGNLLSENTREILDTPYVEVSAHAGARTGKGIGNHAKWQGKVYFWKEKSKDGKNPHGYPDFIKTTGYGKGEGLAGYNCYHRFYAFLPGITERRYSEEELKHMAEDTFTYKGKTYTMYEASQQMRKLERDMRKLKRELIAADGAGLEKAVEFENIAIKLQLKRQAYKRFGQAAGLKERQARTQVLGFDRRLAARARRKVK